MWKFDNLPRDKWDEMRQAFLAGDRAKMIRLHNEYNLSTYDYCCGKNIRNWVKHGLKFYWVED